MPSVVSRKVDFRKQSSDEKEIGYGNFGYDENGLRYLKCKNVSGSNIVTGLLVEVSTTTAETTAEGYVIPAIVLMTTGLRFMGKVVTTTNLLAGNYFWVLKGPIIEHCFVAGSPTVGDRMFADAGGPGILHESSTGRYQVGVMIGLSGTFADIFVRRSPIPVP